MAKRVREVNKWTIPSDWNESADGFQIVALCIPNSQQWRAIFIGRISDLAYGRNYNKLTGTIVDAQAIARDIFESMTMACLDDVLEVLQCICEQNTILAEKSADTGQEVEGGLSDGDIEVGPGEQFPDSQAYFDAKCNVANAIFDTVRGMVQWLEDNEVDLLAGIFGGITSGLLTGILLSGPVGWAWALVGSLIVALAGYIISLGINFLDLGAALDDTHQESVLSLSNASNSLTAENNFIAAVEAGSPPISSVESGLLNIMLSAELLNQLFSPRDDVGQYASPSPIDCGAALLLSWDFDADEEGWTFRDDSTANASATGSYDASAEALSAAQIIVAGGSGRITRAVNVSPTISQAVVPGNSVQWDHSATSDGIVCTRWVKVIYTDATFEEIRKPPHKTAGTLVLTVTQTKNIETIECLTSRSNGSSTTGYSFTAKTLEVRVVGN